MAKRSGAVRRSAAEWAREVPAWRRSGLTCREYAAAHGLKATTLSWWSWKLGSSTQELELVPVEIVDDVEEHSGTWEVVTADGHHIRGDATLSAELVRVLVSSVVGR